MRDPDQFCPRCGHSWGFADEVCEECGLDPVHNRMDGQFYDRAKEQYEQEKDK